MNLLLDMAVILHNSYARTGGESELPMKLIIESNGTLKGTSVEFKMTADEIPKMIARHRRRKMLKRTQPPDIEVSPNLPPVDVVMASPHVVN
jgi:hypothetical protein